MECYQRQNGILGFRNKTIDGFRGRFQSDQTTRLFIFGGAIPSMHRDLNFDSHKRFCTRDFACWAHILDYCESKKDCLNSCRNRSAHCCPSRESNQGPPREQLLDQNFSSRLFIIDFREICLIKHLKYLIVRSFLA